MLKLIFINYLKKININSTLQLLKAEKKDIQRILIISTP